MATMVTPEAPVKAVKSAQVTNAMTARPPGIQPSSASDSLTSRLGARLSPRMNPANVKSGMASSTGVSAMR